MAKMLVSRIPLPTQDDADCAEVALARARKAKRPLQPYKDWCELIQLALRSVEFAKHDYVNSPRLAEHNRLLNELRLSGELDKINKARANAPGFFHEDNIRLYKAWREEQRYILQSMNEPLPNWLNA